MLFKQIVITSILFSASFANASSKSDRATEWFQRASIHFSNIVENEEQELARLFGKSEVSNLSGAFNSVQIVLDNKDARSSEVRHALDSFSKSYSDAIRGFDGNVSRYCWDRSFADRVGDELDALGGDIIRVARSFRIDLELPRPISLDRVCTFEPDGL